MVSSKHFWKDNSSGIKGALKAELEGIPYAGENGDKKIRLKKRFLSKLCYNRGKIDGKKFDNEDRKAKTNRINQKECAIKSPITIAIASNKYLSTIAKLKIRSITRIIEFTIIFALLFTGVYGVATKVLA